MFRNAIIDFQLIRLLVYTHIEFQYKKQKTEEIKNC